MRSGEKMAEWHCTHTMQHNTWWQQVVVTGMEVASLSSRIERLDVRTRLEIVNSWQTRWTEAFAGVHLLILGKAWVSLMHKSNFGTLSTLLSLHHFPHFLFTFKVLKKRLESIWISRTWVCHHHGFFVYTLTVISVETVSWSGFHRNHGKFNWDLDNYIILYFCYLPPAPQMLRGKMAFGSLSSGQICVFVYVWETIYKAGRLFV